jgi:hypothetical protein
VIYMFNTQLNTLKKVFAAAPLTLLAANPTLPPDPNEPAPTLNLIKVDQGTLDAFNPLVIENSPVKDALSTPGGIISRALTFIFPAAGMLLFVMLVIAGFEILSGAAGKKGVDSGKQRATAAVVGFILLFVSYWIIQIVEKIFNVNIFGNP